MWALTRSVQTCFCQILKPKIGEANFVRSFSRRSEVVGTSYLVGLLIYTSITKFFFWVHNFQFLSEFSMDFHRYQEFYQSTTCPKTSARVLQAKILTFSGPPRTHQKTKKCRQNISKLKIFDPEFFFSDASVYE